MKLRTLVDIADNLGVVNVNVQVKGQQSFMRVSEDDLYHLLTCFCQVKT